MKLRKSWLICGTICTVIVLALVLGAVTYGSPNLLFSHGPLPPPNDGSSGNVSVAHGPLPPPNDGSSGNVLLAHGPLPPPNDGSSGNLV